MTRSEALADRTSDIAAAWTRVRAHLRDSAGARLFDQWLKPMMLVETGDADVVRLALPSAFMTNWVKSHYAERLLQEFRALLPEVRAVIIETGRERPAPAVIKAEAPAEVAVLKPRASAVRAAPPVLETL